MGVKSGRGKNRKIAPPDINYARAALVKLKLILGARLYHKSPKIEAIFKKQKERIGDVLDALDTELERNPKEKGGVRFHAWKRQGLKAYWDQYMDEKFEIAKRRSERDMNMYLDMLKKYWHPKQGTTANDKDLIIFWSQIKRLDTAWEKEKLESWEAPW